MKPLKPPDLPDNLCSVTQNMVLFDVEFHLSTQIIRRLRVQNEITTKTCAMITYTPFVFKYKMFKVRNEIS